MKKTSVIIIFMLFISCLFSANVGDEKYCPLETGQHWQYSYFSKKENLQKDDLNTFVKREQLYKGIMCQVYESPSKSLWLYISTEKTGIFVRGATVSMPLLGFINIDIEFKPPAQVMKFPAKQGETWHYEGVAAATTMAFFNIDTKISGDFTAKGLEQVDVLGKTITAFHMSGAASRGWSVEKPITGDCWLAEGIGVVKGETVNSRIELKAHEENLKNN